MTLSWKQLRPEVRARIDLRTTKPHVKSKARMAGGRKARIAGSQLEGAILASSYLPGCPVCLEQLPACGARFVGKGRAHPLPIPCDFIGVVRRFGHPLDGGLIGHALFLDAKSCGPKLGAIRLNDPKILKPHQRRFLVAMRDAGGIAGLLVECRKLHSFLWLDAGHLEIVGNLSWSDGRWLVLGPTNAPIAFARLLQAYRLEES